MKKSLLAIGCLLLLMLPSCLDDNDVDYTEWRQNNEDYYNKALTETTESGNLLYQAISPAWAPGYQVLMDWHTPRQNNKILPLDNSTVDVIYRLRTIDGTVIDSSYRNTLWGDSIYRTSPSKNIPGFWTALTNMCEGDSVTAVVPYNSGYGITGSASVKPYSTLIFDIKLKKIVAWEVPY